MFESPTMKKYLVIGCILLIAGIGCSPGTAQNTEKPSLKLRGDWFYVGGDGPGNYTRIQDAINDSSDGDTVFVYSGIYYERITIRKAINLIGESKNTTVIDAINSDGGELIKLKSDDITISRFTLRFNGDFGPMRWIIASYDPNYAGNVTISDNILQTNKSYGIYLYNGDNCRIINNTIHTIGYGYGWGGIKLTDIDHSTIANNSIISNDYGCELYCSSFNTISNNNFYDSISKAISIIGTSNNNSIDSNKIDNSITITWFLNTMTGISISVEHGDENYHNIITKNSIVHCDFGIYLENSHDTIISQNTFLKNLVDARFYNTGLFSNHWVQNYWGRPQIVPKPIFGIKDIHHIFPGFIEFDWHPAQEPYDVAGMS